VLRFSYSNPLLPDKTYDYDMRTHQLTCLREKTILGQPRIDPSAYTVERDTVLSSDETQVPITLIGHKNLARDSKYAP
jgi:protease II